MAEGDKKVTIGLLLVAGLAAIGGAVVIFGLVARASPLAPAPPGKANLYGIITEKDTGFPIGGAQGTVYQDHNSATEQYNFTTGPLGYYQILDMLVEVDVTQMVVYANGYQTYTNEDIPIVEGNNELSFSMEVAG